MDESRVPDPLPRGALEPPRRRPPTAVGVLTPPPPHRRRRDSAPYRSRLRQRLAQAFVGVTAVSLGAVVTSAAVGVLGVILGSALALGGAPLLVLALRPVSRAHSLPRRHDSAQRRAA